MEKVPYSRLEKGTFLIASPEIDAGLFFRAVILVCEHTPNGSFGLVINKSLDVELPQEILTSEQLESPRIGVRAGGPVQTNQMMLLHNSDALPQQTLQICTDVFLGGDLQFLHDAIRDEKGPVIHLCFGYSGWGPGQLEREFLDGQWLLFPATREAIFHIPPEKLWQSLLREMGGKYASLSMIPEDLSVN
ncbi:MAG: YqgE/AlgH family protein [Chlamydiia bacterium]|nr:YqgE/AlgH family protein [Chlamydiia bacterium]